MRRAHRPGPVGDAGGFLPPNAGAVVVAEGLYPGLGILLGGMGKILATEKLGKGVKDTRGWRDGPWDIDYFSEQGCLIFHLT